MPGGWQLVSLDMPAGMVAVFLADGRPVQVVAANGAAPDVLESDADTVMVLNPTGAAAAFGVSLQGLDRPGFVLQPGGLLTRYGAAAAVWHVAVPEGAAAEAGLPIGIHAFGNGGTPTTGTGWPSFYAEDMIGHSQSCQSLVGSMVLEGVFAHVPDLRVVLIEAGFAWLPPLAWRLDRAWADPARRDPGGHPGRPARSSASTSG